MAEKSKQYKYFQIALAHIMAEKGTGAKSNLAIDTDQSAANITNIIKGKRGASFENMVEIANKLGYDIIEFLQLGQGLLGGQKPIEKPPTQKENEGNSNDTLIKAAEAFCTVLVEESEKVKKKREAG